MPSRFSGPLKYAKAQFTNPYVWVGVLLLLLVGSALFVAINYVAMPAYTRHDAFVTVPDVRAYTYPDARIALERVGLETEEVRQRYTPDAPRDAVVDQNPEPQTRVKPGRRIYLNVNSGEQTLVTVPRLEDLSIREATSRLAALGLRPGALRPDSIPSPYENTITRQTPAPGDSIPPGGTVQLWYSTGYGQSYVTMPDVTGLPLEEAEELLLEVRLRYVVIGGESVERDDENVRVQRQSREPGTRVREGFEIRLFVGDDEPDEEAPQIEY